MKTGSKDRVIFIKRKEKRYLAGDKEEMTTVKSGSHFLLEERGIQRTGGR